MPPKILEASMFEETRIIGDYSVITSIRIGKYEIALCKNDEAPNDERYLCGYIENNGILESLNDCMVSESYADIVAVFGGRVAEKGEAVQLELERIQKEIGDDSALHYECCIPISSEDCIKDKVIVLREDILRPEYKRASYQLLFCTGGFGAQSNARGRTCFATRIYDSEKINCQRCDVLGIVPEENLPDWAKDKLKEIKQIETRKKDTRGDR